MRRSSFGTVFAGVIFWVVCMTASSIWASSVDMPFNPGEKLEYELRWENVPAGSARLEVLPVKVIDGQSVFHFVLTAESNSFLDIFYKVRDRIEAFADVEMKHSVRYEKKQHEGKHQKDEVIDFDWNKAQAQYSNFGSKNEPIGLMDGSFDPLSAFYYTRTAALDGVDELERPITDGKKNIIGRLKVIRRETITLQNRVTYDTYLLEPELQNVGGVFQATKNAKIQVWVTADDKRIPVRITSKVAVGHFIGELVSAEGVY